MKKPKKAAVPNRVSPTAAGPIDSGPFYHPEHAHWFYQERGTGFDLGPNDFQIYAVGENHLPRVVIATVQVNAALTQADAERIVRLMASAPDLWRLLQKVAPCSLDDGMPNNNFREAMDCLWQAADRYPFVWPQPDEQDEETGKQNTEIVTARITKAGAL